MVAPLIITPIAVHFGWRWAFFIIGAVGVFWIMLWLFATRSGSIAHAAVNGMQHTGSQPTAGGTSPVPSAGWFRQVLLHPAFWMLFLVAVTVNPCWYFLNEWIPKYMHDQRGMGYLSAGLVTIPIFLGADLGNILSGGLIKLLAMRGWSVRRARGTTLTFAASLIVPVALITQLGHAYACVALLGLAGMGLTSIVANYTACQQDFSFANVGIVSGILGMSANVFAAVVNPYIGRYVDQTGNYTLIFVFMAVLPVISLTAILVFDTLISRQRGRT
jgi:ACS family hexuronate transporter-like MFS transporter